MKPAFGVLALLLVPGTSASCVEYQSCTGVGCLSGVSAKLSLEQTFDEIRTFSLRVCRNAECVESALSRLEAPLGPDSGSRLQFPESNAETPGPWVELMLWDRGSARDLDVRWNAYDPSSLRDGDVFVITLTDASGAEVRSVSQAVDYAEFYPNGPDCDAVPCRSATITTGG